MYRKLIRAFVPLFLGPFLMAQAAPQAALAAKPPKVEQGKQVTITIKLTPAPNIDGGVTAFVAPADQPSQTTSDGRYSVGQGATSAAAYATIPTDGKLGTWKVVRVIFQPLNSPAVDLTIIGSTTFEVIERKTVLPTTADVQVK